MAFKIKTSKRTEDIISRLELSHNLPCYTLVKLAMALSLRSEKPLEESDFKTNTLGRELNRQTITGDADIMYKCLMELYAQKHLSDEEFFPGYVKAHIDRGIVLLEQEARYSDDLLIHLTELEKGI
jgi:DNA sulfur modification protein DndE